MRACLVPVLYLLASCAASEPTKEPGDPTTDDGGPGGFSGLPGSEDPDPTDSDEDSSGITIVLLDRTGQIPVGESAVVSFRVQAEGFQADDLEVTAVSDLDGPVAIPDLDNRGRFNLPTEGLSAGLHAVAIRATTPDGGSYTETFDVPICEWPALQDFNANPIGAGWQAYGNAYWDPTGWLEITGNVQSRYGSIYKIDQRIDPGDFRMEFRIATGGGINSGADGYAVNVVNVPDVASLEAYIASAANGGCLGYGIGGPTECGFNTVDAFHIEFDTWQNGWDPTSANHIAINLDGDPGAHPLWTTVPTLENLQWRQIAVQTQGAVVTVEMDGVVVMQGEIPLFRFDGGYIGLSGSTGWATNFHRFDDLQLYDRCTVPLGEEE